jgi:two-component system chemotaxis sensor kinase CheA
LATQLILDAGGSRMKEFAGFLFEIERQARLARCDEAAGIASDLSKLLASGAAPESAGAEIAAGLARIREALSSASSDLAPGAAAPAGPEIAPSLAQDPELVADFVLESREHLAAVEQHVLTLDRDPANSDAIHAVFRGFHTIKGLAGFLEFAPIQEMAHEIETILNLAREGKLAITAAVTDVILDGVDYLSGAIAQVESGAPCCPLPGHVRLLCQARCLVADDQPAIQGAPTAFSMEPQADAAPPPAREDTKQPATADSFSVRVDTAKLDYLVDMVGELVIAQSLVRHHRALATLRDPSLERDFGQLARITGEVQRTVMATRMVPIGQLFQRTARQVRDLSRKVGKPVELVARGEETELDKTIAEELADPLMHMVRNAIDHGIETPAEREAACKPEQAKITLAAYHQAGQIVIEISDDGRGLDPQRILAKARQKRLLEDSTKVPDADVLRLILHPGFSTADEITDLSGRGVGMDVVRKQVEKLRGRIEISSQPGVGTTFLLKLPLTLAIIDGLVVAIGKDRYIVPVFAVREMFRPAAESIFTIRGRQEMALVRGRLLPVIRLYRRFNLSPRTEDPCRALLIVAESEGRCFCLMVDDLIGKQEVVIKSLGDGIGKVAGIAGGAILGDGRVGLILDVGGLWGTHANA